MVDVEVYLKLSRAEYANLGVVYTWIHRLDKYLEPSMYQNS